jgi:hypothetical protein
MNGKANKRSRRKRQNNGIKLNEILNSYGAIVILPFRRSQNSQQTLRLLLIPSKRNKINFLSLAQLFISFFFFEKMLAKMEKTIIYTASAVDNSSPRQLAK